MKQFFEPKPLIFTTGGAEPGLIEDTIHNFKKAVMRGSDVIRTNVFLTRDEKIIAASDAVFQQKAIMQNGLDCHTLSDLRAGYQRTDPPDGSTNNSDDLFPELSHILESFPGQRFNFNLIQKSDKLTNEFCSTIDGMGAVARTLVSSFRNHNFRIIRGRLPEIATAFSFPAIIGFYALFKTGLIYFKRSFRPDAMIIPEMIGASLLANEGLIREAQSKGIHVYLLAVTKEEQAAWLCQAGVDGFITNNIEMIRRVAGIT